ncbi:unnamed protein product [Pleuronectes platessa]|uniref:Uncharacterized protein n=1 Tax=Pleuronectes platessa TaxID=8262 RepID=A0A9N7Z4P1_PLEPL|nr:unnamed protein product [Pleuronectes platessa]
MATFQRMLREKTPRAHFLPPPAGLNPDTWSAIKQKCVPLCLHVWDHLYADEWVSMEAGRNAFVVPEKEQLVGVCRYEPEGQGPTGGWGIKGQRAEGPGALNEAGLHPCLREALSYWDHNPTNPLWSGLYPPHL